MLALFITGIFSRNERHWAVCPQLKKVVPLLLLLPGTVLLTDGDVFNRLALSEAALLGQDSRYKDQNKAAAAFIFRLAVCHLPARPGDEAVCAQHLVPSSEEGGRIQLRHQKRAPRANPQYRVVLLNVMLALFITGIFSRYERQWAVCPQLKKAYSFFFLSMALYCSSTATFSTAWPSPRPLF